MSGGALKYVFRRIDTAAEDVKQYLEKIELGDYDEYFKPSSYYRESYPGRKDFADAKLLKEAVVKRLRDAVEALQKASVYALRAEWLMSDDDGWESFIMRTDEELNDLEGKRHSDGDCL